MTMKKILSNIYTLAALLMAGAAFTACSSSDDIIEQPANPTEPKVYTMVIKASKGDANTRALSLDGSTLNACWSGEETIEVYQSGEKIGTATAAASTNGNTTITATLNSAPNPSNDLNFYLGGKDPVYTGQNGLLTGTGSISEKYDYVESLIYSNAYTVEGYNVIPGEFTTLNFTDGITHQAVIKFTLKDKGNSDAAISPSALTITDGTSTVELTNIPASTYTANGAGVLYVAFPAAGSATITLTATVGSDTYTYTTPSAKTFVNGKYYEITVKMTKQLGHALTSAVVGDIVGSDGLAYAVADKDNLPSGVTAVAMVAYMGSASDCTNGLAIAMEDVSESMLSWNNSGANNDGKTAAELCDAWNTSKPIKGGTWRLPSIKDWQYMFIGCGASDSYSDNPTTMSYSPFASKLSSANGKALQQTYYWASTESSPGSAWYHSVYYGNTYTDFDVDSNEGNPAYVRACLAF